MVCYLMSGHSYINDFLYFTICHAENRGRGALIALELSKCATPKRLRGNDCAGIAPTKDSWYSELLLIENAPETFPD